MSDPNSAYGEPVEEPTPADDDVVGRAHEGLADAEAAGRDAVGHDDVDGYPDDAEIGRAEPAYGEPAFTDAPAATEYPDADAERPHVEPLGEPAYGEQAGDPEFSESVAGDAYSEPVAESASDEPAYTEPAYTEAAYTEPEYVESTSVESAYVEPAAVDQTTRDGSADAPTVVAPVTSGEDATPVEPTYVAPVVQGQPIFVQAPEAPRPKGNRGAAGAIGLLAAICFGVLYLAAWIAIAAIEGIVTDQNIGDALLAALGTWSLWVPIVVFFLAFWLLGAIINRGRWGIWVVLGLLVGVAAYGGHLLGAMFQAPFWMLTAREGAELVETQLVAPLAIAAFIFGRELTIWFGAWVAARGKRVTELNTEAQREYERTLEAGPSLVRQ